MVLFPALEDDDDDGGGIFCSSRCCDGEEQRPAEVDLEEAAAAASSSSSNSKSSSLAEGEEGEKEPSLERLLFYANSEAEDKNGGGGGTTRSAVTAVKTNGAGQPVFYTDVVVVGNGPSGLSLSAFLAGYRPYYDGRHPNTTLHENMSTDKSKSLLEQDLSNLCEGLQEGRTNHQISLLYDSLVRPEADTGQENPSTLTWRQLVLQDENEDDKNGPSISSSNNQSSYVPHLVLGKGAIGGTWADLQPEVNTLSFASWLELPAYSFREWLERDGANFATDLQMRIDATRSVIGRVPCAAIRRYYRDYVRVLGLQENIFEYALVTSVRKRVRQRSECECDDEQDGGDYNWDVHGCYSGGPFHIRCRWVVVAAGVNEPRRLAIPGGDDPRILHSTNEIDRAALIDHPIRNNGRGEILPPSPPVLIIGDGLSAADAIIKCLINGIPVAHSFRKAPRDPQQILSKLSQSLYPEYHTVFQLMVGALTDTLYESYVRTEVQRFEFPPADLEQTSGGGGEAAASAPAAAAMLRDLKTVQLRRVEFSRAAVLIGFEADLAFLNENEHDSNLGQLRRDNYKLVNSKTNTLMVDPITCRCSEEENLYALGPLIGDNYVRYVIGGSLAAAADILKRKKADGDY